MSNPSYSVMGDDPGDDDDVREKNPKKPRFLFYLLFFFRAFLMIMLTKCSTKIHMNMKQKKNSCQ